MPRVAVARDSYVQDGAGLFSTATVATLNSEISAFNGQTGKEIVVVTVPSLDGASLQNAVQQTFSQQQVNGVLFFLARDERQDAVVGDRASQAFFPPGTFSAIHQAMRGYFRNGDFNGGIQVGVNLVLDEYRSHARTAASGAVGAGAVQGILASGSANGTSGANRGGGISVFWLILILIAGFLVIRAIFRAMAGPRSYPAGYAPRPGMGPGYGGYGPGYGGFGGGGFFSGLLGGLGGAWLGNELFGRQMTGGTPGAIAGADPASAAVPDASGWQADPGQADMGNAGMGGFGDGSSGWGDFGGGGGGGDMGGGGGW
ncbi:MAG: TPM domain-containing protein [Vulcanimicrobiaceae bacterium]